ncbi:tetratricopeptide repeat protein [Chryseobacterium sp. SIMBA_029]|uniref:tetratricopeptide repeat protein n=1 Tax=Chryseobacterium sp. SIMBA_029 TaxID=3085772 RepID=UPI00397DBA12
MIMNNIPREKIILWNKEMLEKMKKENYARGIIWAHINIATQYSYLGNGEESIKNLNIAEKISDKNETDFFTVAKIYQEYSLAYYLLNLDETGLKYNAKAVYYGNKIENSNKKNKFLSSVYSLRANFLYKTKDLDSALHYLQRSCVSYESPVIISQIAYHFIEFKPNQDSAKIYLDKAIKVMDKRKNETSKYQMSVFYYYNAQYFFKEKDYKNAIFYLDKALDYSRNLKNSVHTQNLYRLLSASYKNLGNTEKEKEYLEYYVKLKDSLEEPNSKGVDLSIKNIEQEKTEEKNTLKKKTFLYAGIAGFLSLLVLSYLYYQNKKKKKVISEKQELILQKEDETLVLKSRIADAHEEIMQLAKNNDIGFLSKFQEVYPDVSKKLLELNPDLTQDNLIFCALIWLGFSSKDIAEFTFMQHKSVQIKKNRLRKKLNLDSEVDLYHFLKYFEEY